MDSVLTTQDLMQAINKNYEYLKNANDDQLSQCAGTIRTTLELAVKLFWLQKINKQPPSLCEAINDSRFASNFSKFVISDMHQIRMIGNSVVHNGTKITLDETKEMIKRLFYCLNQIEQALGVTIIKPTQPTKATTVQAKENNTIDKNKLAKMANGSKVIQALQEKIIAHGGKSLMPVLKGNPVPFYLSSTNDGLISEGLPKVVLEWHIFDAIVKKAISLGGKMYRGDSAAQNGAKIGSDELPLDTIDGFISTQFYGAQEGNTTLRRSTYYAGILDWAGIAVNHRSQERGGFITINPEYMND